MRLLLSVIITFCSVTPAFGSVVSEFLVSVRDCIEEAASMSESREAILDLVDQLEEEGHVVARGQDAALRPVFVSLQGVVENLLSVWLLQRRFYRVVGAIHTPMPPTPLCTEGGITRELVDPSIVEDSKRLYTIVSRAQVVVLCMAEGLVFDTIISRARIVREYLSNGGVLLVAYPRVGLGNRSAEQQVTYCSELHRHPDNLIDAPLDKLPEDMVGATYFAKTASGEVLIFSIKALQANAPDNTHCWEMWLSSYNDIVAKKRLDTVFNFIRKHSKVNMRQYCL